MLQARERTARKRINLTVASDQMLLELARDGLSEAFGELWSRHSGAVTAATRSFTGYDPEELTQEAFLKVYTSVRRGGELPASFRAYVASTSRRLAIDRSRRDGGVVNVSYEDHLDEQAFEQADFSERLLDDSTTSQAFRALPTRQREALWYRDVEDLPVQEIARYLGASPNTTTVLIKRAREAFKTAWIHVQLSPARRLPAECATIVPKLADHSRGKLVVRDRARVDAHLLDCTHCAALASEANQLHEKLALVLLPLLILGGAPSYAAWVQSKQNRTPLPAAANYVNVAVRGSKRLPMFAGAGAGAGAAFAIPAKSLAAATAAAVVGVLLVGGGALAVTGFLATEDADSLALPYDADEQRAAAGERDGRGAARSATAALNHGEIAPTDAEAGENRAGVPLGSTGPGAGLDRSELPGILPPGAGGGSPGSTGGAAGPGAPQDSGGPTDSAPIVYPEFRPLSGSVAHSPFVLNISATPGATVTLKFGSQTLDTTVEILVNAAGEASYDFPDHRGLTISIRMNQRYPTAQGEETSMMGVALHDVVVPA